MEAEIACANPSSSVEVDRVSPAGLSSPVVRGGSGPLGLRVEGQRNERLHPLGESLVELAAPSVLVFSEGLGEAPLSVCRGRGVPRPQLADHECSDELRESGPVADCSELDRHAPTSAAPPGC